MVLIAISIIIWRISMPHTFWFTLLIKFVQKLTHFLNIQALGFEWAASALWRRALQKVAPMKTKFSRTIGFYLKSFIFFVESEAKKFFFPCTFYPRNLRCSCTPHISLYRCTVVFVENFFHFWKTSTTLKLPRQWFHFIANQYFLISNNVFSLPRPLSIQQEWKEEDDGKNQALSFLFVFVMRSWNVSNRHVYVE